MYSCVRVCAFVCVRVCVISPSSYDLRICMLCTSVIDKLHMHINTMLVLNSFSEKP